MSAFFKIAPQCGSPDRLLVFDRFRRATDIVFFLAVFDLPRATGRPIGVELAVLTRDVDQLNDVAKVDNKLGVTFAAETGFLIETNPDIVRAPDAAFVRREKNGATK